MTLTQNDIGVLVHVAKRIRPIGAPRWDDTGVAKFVRDLDNRGFGFDEILDRVIAHGRDRAARTPAVLMTSISAQPAAPSGPRAPTRTQQCPDCGLRRTSCVCDPKVTRKPVVDSQAPGVKAALDHARKKITDAKQQATA